MKVDRYKFKGALLVGTLFLGAACINQKAEFSWLEGSQNVKLQQIEEQLGGLSQTMMEVGYRYSELYWAGQDENWQYAMYQVEHMEEAIKLGLTRRPLRAASAEMIFPVLNQVESAIKKKQLVGFEQAFEQLTASCNSCHVAENVASFIVAPPQQRISPIVGGPQ